MARLLIILIVIAAVAAGVYYMGKMPASTAPMPGAGVAPAAAAETDLYSAGNTLWLKSEYSTAVATYRNALSRKPGDPRAAEARFRIADSLEHQDNPNEALKAYREFVEAYPSDDRAERARKRIEYLLGTGAK